MKLMHCILFFLLGLCIFVNGDSLNSILSEMEDSLLAHKKTFLDAYMNRCSTTKCQCSRSACYSQFTTEPECRTDFGNNKTSCPLCGGRQLSFDQSSILYPEGVLQTTDECWTSELDNSWKKAVSETVKWQYIGLANGHSRTYPGRRDDCRGGKNYDPRGRPWFISATSGPKDVVLIIDVSGSMDDFNKMGYAKKAAIQVVSTLSPFDYFNVVTFSNNAQALMGNSLLRATKQNIDKMVSRIKNLEPNGATNFIAGFESGFSLFSSFQDSSNCNRAVLFLTDGYDNFATDASQIYNRIAQLNKNINATIFTFSLGVDASNDVPYGIACKNNGIWSKSDDSLYITAQMSQYYLYYAHLRNESIPVWTEPYDDINGAGEMTTVSIAVYDESVNPPYLIGVLGMDILTTDMKKYTENYEDLLNRLISRSKKCVQISPSTCDLEILRKNFYISGNSDSSQPPTCTNQTCTQQLPTPCISNPSIPDFCEETSEYKLEDACCKCFPPGAIVGIVFGSLIFIVLLILSIVLLVKVSKKRSKKESSPPPSSSSQSQGQSSTRTQEVEMDPALKDPPPYSEY